MTASFQRSSRFFPSLPRRRGPSGTGGQQSSRRPPLPPPLQQLTLLLLLLLLAGSSSSPSQGGSSTGGVAAYAPVGISSSRGRVVAAAAFRRSRSTGTGSASRLWLPPPLRVSTSAPPMEASSTPFSSSSDSSSSNNNHDGGGSGGYPELGDDGLYHIMNREQHAAFLRANKDKLVVVKVFAPWCRACAGLAPKFLQLVQSPTYQNLPLVWADLSIQHNKNFVKELGVLALPSVQFYVGEMLAENFPCGPSKVPILKRKLAQLVNAHVDPQTRQVKLSSLTHATGDAALAAMAGGGGGIDAASSASAGSGSMAATLATESDVLTPLGVESAAFATSAASAPAFNDTVVEQKLRMRDAIVGGAVPPPAIDDGTLDAVATIPPTASWRPASLSVEEMQKLIANIPFLQELSLADLDDVLSKAKLFTFEAGSIIMREGRKGRTFYIIADGEVEICQRTQYDPMATADSYLGSVINRLGPGDYFGERALITGEPRAASIRAAETATCLVFDRDDFPASSVLSGRTRNNVVEGLEGFNEKYGVSLSDLLQNQVRQQIVDASTFSQNRGSVNSPRPIKGVDTAEDEDMFGVVPPDTSEPTEAAFPTASAAINGASSLSPPQSSLAASFTMADRDVVSLLTRFQMIRHVSRCLNYIEQMRVQWGDEGIRLRRSMLVSRLPVYQQREFRDSFQLIDASGDGKISLAELKRVMETIGETKSDDELLGIFTSGKDAEKVLTEEDFMGIMAEAEFYTLFRDIFEKLDPYDTGFVRARDLDRVLCGVRDLISDDRKSIIDVEDDEMLIDYEQFSRMLLGSALY